MQNTVKYKKRVPLLSTKKSAPSLSITTQMYIHICKTLAKKSALCLSIYTTQVLHNASQQRVYESCAEDLVRDLMRGFNGTLLAYGQTGAGT